MKILIDTNVLLDLLQNRQPFVEDALPIFEQLDQGKLSGAIAAISITNIYYIVRKISGREIANQAINQLLATLHLIPVDRAIIEQAIALNFHDFEDAVQCACAVAWQADVIVTRNPTDFQTSPIPVRSPKEILNPD